MFRLLVCSRRVMSSHTDDTLREGLKNKTITTAGRETLVNIINRNVPFFKFFFGGSSAFLSLSFFFFLLLFSQLLSAPLLSGRRSRSDWRSRQEYHSRSGGISVLLTGRLTSSPGRSFHLQSAGKKSALLRVWQICLRGRRLMAENTHTHTHGESFFGRRAVSRTRRGGSGAVRGGVLLFLTWTKILRWIVPSGCSGDEWNERTVKKHFSRCVWATANHWPAN